MSNKTYVLIAILVVAAAVAGVFYFKYKPGAQVACTMEAKLCPDGSAVGRTSPNCEFAKCPDIRAAGLIKGKVSVGPICPVERPGVPCPVPREAYTSREVILYAANGTMVVKRTHFAADGTYRFEVPAGTYVLDIPRQQGIGGSRDLPKTLTVKSGETLEVNFSIDTGIR
jgi:hypothetical protein